MKRLFIAADIEGCAAVSSQHELSAAGWGWQKAREWMTQEVSAACRVALDQGFDEVIVADGHGNAQNILPDELPANVRLIRSWPRPLLQMQGVDQPGVQGCFFIGNHAGAQQIGLLAHTYHGGAIRDLRLNGTSASEGYFNAALAADLGRPIWLVTGDEAAVADAQRYAPNAVHCAVKQAGGWRSQGSMMPQQVYAQIAAAAKEALEHRAKLHEFVIERPIVVEIEFTTQLAAEMMDYLPICERTGPYTVKTICETMIDAMKFVSFSILYSPTGTISL